MQNSIVITRKIAKSTAIKTVKPLITNIEVSEIEQRDPSNSPHVIRSSFMNYLKNDFMYKRDWQHPVSKEIYTHENIRLVLHKYMYISPQIYKALHALWIGSSSRETLANLFSYSPSTIRRKWDTGINMIILMLGWPELVVNDLQIYPNC